MKKLRVVHYINQFFAGIGGEEKADYKPEVRETVIGPGLALNAGFKGEAEIVATVICGDSYFGENMEQAKAEVLEMVKKYNPDLFIAGPAFNAGRYGVAGFKGEAEIVATVICGDSYFGENMEQAKAEVLEMVKKYNPDLFIAGPAFNAGRYGVAAGTITEAVQNELGIPALTGMYIENPGADMFKKSVYVVSTKNSAAGMKDAVSKMVPLALKLVKGEEIGSPAEEGYIERGVRKNIFREDFGGKRAVAMMIKKLKGEEFETEFPMPVFDKVDPNPAVKDITKAKVALVTSGGIVPHGNPDHIESSSASKYGKYDIEGVMNLKEGEWETAHGGYDPVYANQDPDRVLPVDALRELEKEGQIGSLHRYFYTTVGNGTAVASAKGFAEKFSKELVADGVDAVILTST